MAEILVRILRLSLPDYRLLGYQTDRHEADDERTGATNPGFRLGRLRQQRGLIAIQAANWARATTRVVLAGTLRLPLRNTRFPEYSAARLYDMPALETVEDDAKT